MDNEDKILQAASDLLSERGIAGITLDDVVVRARVHPSTVYRKWRSRSELAADLLRREAAKTPELHDQGELRADLNLVVAQLARSLSRVRSLLASLTGESARDPELAAECRLFVNAWLNPLADLMSRALQRGELTSTTDVQWTVVLLASTVWFKVMVQGEAGVENSPERIVDPLLRTLSSQPVRGEL
jgi:AcrR family transcriptional regulator